jgi:hypothetical protein
LILHLAKAKTEAANEGGLNHSGSALVARWPGGQSLYLVGKNLSILGEVGELPPCGRPHQPFLSLPLTSGIQGSEKLHLAGR